MAPNHLISDSNCMYAYVLCVDTHKKDEENTVAMVEC